MTATEYTLGGFTALTTFTVEPSPKIWASKADAVAYAREFGDPKRANRSFNAACRYCRGFNGGQDGPPLYRRLDEDAQLNLPAVCSLLEDPRLFQSGTGFGADSRRFVAEWCDYAIDELARFRAWYPFGLEEFLALCRLNSRLEVTLADAEAAGSTTDEICRFYQRRLGSRHRVTIRQLLPYLERYNMRWDQLVEVVCLVLKKRDRLHPDYVWREQVLRRPQEYVRLELWG